MAKLMLSNDRFTVQGPIICRVSRSKPGDCTYSIMKFYATHSTASFRPVQENG